MNTCSNCKHWHLYKPHEHGLGSCAMVVETIAPANKPDAMVILVGFPEEQNLILYRGTYGCNQFEQKESGGGE